MRGQTPDGRAAEAVKRRPMRDQDLLDDRDILMLCQRIQGRPDRETAKMFGISRQLLQRRLNAIPAAVEGALRKMVRQQLADQGAVVLTPDQGDALRFLMRKQRRVEAQTLA